MKRKIALGFCSIILFLSLLSFTVTVEAQETKGNISFEPNVIPELKIQLADDIFKFHWLNNHFDLKLLVAYQDKTGLKLLSLKDFWEKDKTAIKWNQLKHQATDSMYEFGYTIDDIPQEIADNVEYLVWKIEGASFDEKEIEVEEIDSFVDLGYNITRFHLPNNLILSYEDVYRYNFTVSHPNKLETKLEGVKGKSSWNLDPITFSGGIITITGYNTEGGACSHNDIYNAMLNSTFQKTGNQYYSNAKIVIGDGENTTWFVDTNVQVEFNASVFTANYHIAYWIRTNCYLRFGILSDATEKVGANGVDVRITVSGYLLGQSLIFGDTDSDVQLYSSHFVDVHSSWAKSGRLTFKGTTKIYSVTSDNVDFWSFAGSTLDINDIIFNSSNEGHIAIYGGTPTISRVSSYASKWVIQFYLGFSGNVGSFYQRKSALPSEILFCQEITVDHNITNGDLEAWTFRWQGTSTAEIYRQYTFDLTITFNNGSYAEGTNVTISNTYLGTSDSWILTSNGSIPQQTYGMGHYNQTGGDTIYNYNPYNITATLDGYQTYTQLINVTKLEDLTIALTEETANGNGSRFHPTYYLLGGLSMLPFALLIAVWYKRHKQNGTGL